MRCASYQAVELVPRLLSGTTYDPATEEVERIEFCASGERGVAEEMGYRDRRERLRVTPIEGRGQSRAASQYNRARTGKKKSDSST